MEEVENKVPGVSGLVNAVALNTKTVEVENKIPDYAKYITTIEFNKFSGIEKLK